MAPRWRVSLRVSLMVLMPALVFATGAAIAVASFSSTRQAVDRLADDLFRDGAEAAAEGARAHLLRALPALATAPLLYTDDSDELARRLLAILRANPTFSWVSYADAQGRFTGASRTADGSVRLNQSEIRDGKTPMVEHDVASDGTWTLRRREEDTHYDPRTRPFYVRAAAARRRVWTEPYVFYGSGVPGITCALPRLDEGHAVLGVFTVDFDLNALSKAVRGVRIGEHGRAFLLTKDGTVLAHPTVHLVEKTDSQADGRLVTTNDVADPALRGWSRAAAEAGAAAGTPFRFESGGERWLGTRIAVPIDEGLAWEAGVVAPEDDFLGAVERSRRTALAIAATSLLVAVAVSLVLAGRIARPLERIAERMTEAGRLRLDGDPTPPSRFTEVERMREALGKMRGGLRSFARYVPADLVRRLLDSGREATLGADAATLTILFTDIAGFTATAERTPPDELVKELGSYFDEATRVVSAEGGTIDKFIGDAVMAFWGAPEPDPAHALRALTAAIRFRDALRERRSAGAPWAAAFPTRIGIATGPVVVGNVGATERMNYTALGDAVNLASRLESLNTRYGTSILADESTIAEAGDRVVSRPIDVVAVKGRLAATTVHEPLALSSDATPRDLALARAFKEGLDAYGRRDFAGAAAAYRRGLDVACGDGVAEGLLERAERLARDPPDGAWDGVTTVDEK